MSLLPNQSFIGPGKSLFAPVGSSGGGGGGSAGGNIVCSSITFNGQIAPPILEDIQFPGGYTGTILADQFQVKSDGNNNLVFFDAQNRNISLTDDTTNNTCQIGLDATGGLTFLSQPSGATPPQIYMLSPTSVSSFVVSSINGSQYPPSQSDVFSTIQVSSINGLQYPPGQSDNFSTLNCSTLLVGSGYIDAPAVNGSLRIQRYTSGSQGSQIEYISSGINCAAVNFGVSTLQVVQADFITSSINGLEPIGTFQGAQDTPGLQAGYVNQLPYLSTILFPHSYTSDKVSVVFGANNAGVSGGANPNISLNSGYGTNGVSSIGFEVDMRNGGVGFQGNFFWMAFPWTN